MHQAANAQGRNLLIQEGPEMKFMKFIFEFIDDFLICFIKKS